ncbi:YhcH/YjgK/YiaL family protein [Bifidobacterium crudilactis]|jgi:YhcH/YjgK/YiaL family protein|uniref:YhcH/YjgK/YiaL family protein n=1 Tax=Bifidobacterium crudilactis TaxID=327277 RepID=UPI002352E744|nr:YhcH/YjgK/YiaL family protein [Bifidobacterium crudilactis]MCI1218534.1 YhcH/YjgK/YiaL family protein [Bifidobacterium crudilactis]
MLWANVSTVDEKDYAKLLEAVRILRGTDWSGKPDKHIDVNESFFAQLLEYNTQPIEDVDFEIHHHRLDIHFIVSGQETIQVSQARPAEKTYLAERDLAFVEPPATFSSVVMHQGDVLIIGMDEPHRTNGLVNGEVSAVRKVVLKMKQ